MHKYYVRVIAELLANNSRFGADYAFRHPLPPYISHYLILFGLSRVFSLDRAEECFVCIILFALAYGVRYCARSVGPGGDLVSFLVAPLLLNFVLLMGFLNYTLGMALSLFAAGMYLRASQGRSALWIAYACVIALLAVTHPVPLMLLLVFLCLQLAADVWNSTGKQHRSLGIPWIKENVARLIALILTGIAFLYPVMAADRSRSQADLHGFHLHRRDFVHFASLSSVMPYDPHSTELWINLFRLLIYLVIGSSILIAARGLWTRLRERNLGAGDTFLLSGVILMFAVPVMPDQMNGSAYFASRMLIFGLFGCVIAAAQLEIARPILRTCVATLALVGVVSSLWMANHYFRPVSSAVVALEREPLPANGRGLVISDPDGLIGSLQSKLGIGSVAPYAWAGALPVVRTDGEILNPPWLDLTIMPLAPQPAGTLHVNLLTAEERKIVGGPNDGGIDFMRQSERDRLLDEADFIVFTGPSEDLSMGLPTLLHSDEVLQFACRPARAWYQVCVRR